MFLKFGDLGTTARAERDSYYVMLTSLAWLVTGVRRCGGVIKANFIFYWVVAFYNLRRRCPHPAPMNEYLMVKFVPHFCQIF